MMFVSVKGSGMVKIEKSIKKLTISFDGPFDHKTDERLEEIISHQLWDVETL